MSETKSGAPEQGSPKADEPAEPVRIHPVVARRDVQKALDAGFSADEVIWMLDLPEPITPGAQVDGEVFADLTDEKTRKPQD